MYYKIISDGEIVDVCSDLTFVRWQSKNGMFLTIPNEDGAAGIISSDGSTVYLLEGAEQTGSLSYATYTEITEEEYISLHDQLVENGVLENQETEDTGSGSDNSDGGTAGNEEKVAKSALLQQIESLQSQVDLLTKCILEISQQIYV